MMCYDILLQVSRVPKKDSGSSSNGDSVGTLGGSQITNRRDPVAIQCVMIPEKLCDQFDLSIAGIFPTCDAGHVLVVLSASTMNLEEECQFESQKCNLGMDVDVEAEELDNILDGVESTSKCSGCTENERTYVEALTSNVKPAGSVLLIYSLNFDSECVKLDEVPISVRVLDDDGETPIEVTLLPLTEREDSVDSPGAVDPIKGCPLGLASIVCKDGAVRIVNLATLKTVSVALPEKTGTKFVSAAYCNSKCLHLINIPQEIK